MLTLPADFAAAFRDSYVLERELGRGSMATVYLAEDLKHHRRVALKVLHAHLAGVLGPERFLREIATVAAQSPQWSSHGRTVYYLRADPDRRPLLRGPDRRGMRRARPGRRDCLPPRRR